MSTVSVTNLKHESASGNNITLDSNGRVGVNNASPAYQVDVVRSGGGTDVVRVKGDAGNAFVRFEDSDASAQYTVGADDNGPTGSGSFVIYDRTTSTYRWRLDAAGRVTTPYQPVFSAYKNTGLITTTGTIVFNVASVNVGSHYNTSTGVFTAPVSGVYGLNFFILAQASDNWDIRLYKNASVYPDFDIRCNNNAVASNLTTGGNIVVSLAANDTMSIKVDYLPSGDIYAFGLNGFSMWLIG